RLLSYLPFISVGIYANTVTVACPVNGRVPRQEAD
ncbi:MAG: hypothetical protein ACI8TL_001675, partial [Natronomonas sp.]